MLKMDDSDMIGTENLVEGDRYLDTATDLRGMMNDRQEAGLI